VRQKKENFFVSSKEYHARLKKHPKSNPVSVVEKLDHYAYFTEKELKNIFLNIQSQKSHELMWDAFTKNPLRVLKEAAANPDRVLRIDTSTYLLYPMGSDIPTPIPLYLDYIEGIRDSEYDLDKAQEILSKNSWVSELERIDIPSYNGECGEQALCFKVLLPKDVWNELIKKCKKNDSEFWSCRLHGHLCYKDYIETDLLKVKPAYKRSHWYVYIKRKRTKHEKNIPFNQKSNKRTETPHQRHR
jgi:hypothetical protein